MELRQLGTSDLQVSAVCLGTMTFGQQNTEAEGHAQLDRAFAAGINFIDTAEMYSVPTRPATYGATETIVGTWLKQQARDKVIVATKTASPGRNMHWIRNGPEDLSAANLRAAVEASLQRLQTDYIDLYQIHWPARNTPMFGGYRFEPEKERPATPIAEQLEGLATLVREGKIRYIGLSNETPWGAMEFLRLADQLGLPRPVSVQNAFNLLNRVADMGMSEVCYREKLALLPYSPLGFGMLSGKYRQAAPEASRLALFPQFGQRYAKPSAAPAVAAYADLAQRHNLSPTTLALAWVYRHWCVTSTIIGATSLQQLDENLAVWEVQLEPAVLEEIEAIHLQYSNPAP